MARLLATSRGWRLCPPAHAAVNAGDASQKNTIAEIVYDEGSQTCGLPGAMIYTGPSMAELLAIGTSGYAYREWEGTMYPTGATEERLPAYATHFPTVELNNTFFRMPTAAALAKLSSRAPDNFTFTIKAPQEITHDKRLKQATGSLDAFFAGAAALGAHRGPALFSIPAFLKKDVPRLRDFLAAVPTDARVACEFANPTWHSDDVLRLLAEHNAALALLDVDEAALCTPRHVTAPWGYVRLRRAEYSQKQLQVWTAWLQAQNWSQVFVFFKQAHIAKSPKYASTMIGLTRS